MLSKIKILVFTLLILLTTLSTNAQFYKKWKVVNKIVKIATIPAILPVKVASKTIKTTVNVVTRKESPKDMVTVVRSTATSPGAMFSEELENAQFIKLQMQNYVSKHVGHAGSFVIDLGDFMGNYSASSAISTTNYANIIIDGGNPESILGAPLAAAIREAQDRFSSQSKPIPDDVKKELAKRNFSIKTLDEARYAIGTVEIALPNFISKFKEYFAHQEVAVTVGNIIVFPKDPGTLYTENCTWWAHELTHVQQYEEPGGIEAFAYSYSKDVLARKAYQDIALEKAAIDNADKITGGNNCNYMEMTSSVGRAIRTLNNNLPETGKIDTAHYFNTILRPNESYIAQCHISSSDIGGMFFITNFSRIIAVNPITGQALQVGNASKPPSSNTKNYAWIFDLPGKHYDYGVKVNGHIEKLIK